jgi:hypothetical protein
LKDSVFKSGLQHSSDTKAKCLASYRACAPLFGSQLEETVDWQKQSGFAGQPGGKKIISGGKKKYLRNGFCPQPALRAQPSVTPRIPSNVYITGRNTALKTEQ